MASVVDYNDGQPKSNPYGKITDIPVSFTNVEYYDCYIPYMLTNEQLGGYRLTPYHDSTPGQQADYQPMQPAIKGMRVANYVNIEEIAMWPNFNSVQQAISSGRIQRIYDSTMHCHYMVKNGIKFYEMAVQPFFLRQSIGVGDPTDGFYPYSSTDNRGQLIDVILTSGKCIHFVLGDVNSTAHTNCEYLSAEQARVGNTDFAPCQYDQYHNIVSMIAGNTIELIGEGGQKYGYDESNLEQWCNRKLARKYNLGTWGANGSSDIAFYRVYKHRIQDDATLNVTELRMKEIDYDINFSPGPGPTPTPSSSSGYEIIEKGIFGLNVNLGAWITGTGLRKLGDYVKLKATINNGRVTWSDITNPAQISTYSPTELAQKYGISYTKVNNGYVGKFYVAQQPLPPELGGTGARSLDELLASVQGVDNGEYDFSGVTPGVVGAGSIELPNIGVGHYITAEARSEERGSILRGDQGQSASGIDDNGEVSFVFDRKAEWSAVYRLYSDDSAKNATFRKYALQAANHACFLVQNKNVGYNFLTDQAGLIQYIKNNRGNIQFNQFSTPSDTNCMNLCKLAYMATFPQSYESSFSVFWTTAGILNGNTLEKLGFRKFGSTYAQNPTFLEIGDILVLNGHGAIVVGVGGKDWVLNGTDYNPKLGEVKT